MKNLLKKNFFKMRKTRIQKLVVPETYIETEANTKPHLKKTLKNLINRSERYERGNSKMGLEINEMPIPISPVLRPIKIQKPTVGKKYYWCSCGMSDKQPFCDGSHKNTAFQPFEFTFEEPTEWAFFCGCKLSKDKPFCDGKTCLEIQGVNVEEK